MHDITIRCRECRATIILPPPDVFETGDGVMIPADPANQAEDALAVVTYMRGLGCPTCGGHDLTLAEPV